MFSDYFAVQLVEFYEVRPPQHKIFEKFCTFDARSRVSITEIAYGHRSTLQTIAVVLGSHWYYDYALVVSIMEDWANLFLVRFVEEENLLVFYRMISQGRSTYISCKRCIFRSPVVPLQIDCLLLASQAHSFFFASCSPA